jgi:hypothetical protein
VVTFAPRPPAPLLVIGRSGTGEPARATTPGPQGLRPRARAFRLLESACYRPVLAPAMLRAYVQTLHAFGPLQHSHTLHLSDLFPPPLCRQDDLPGPEDV